MQKRIPIQTHSQKMSLLLVLIAGSAVLLAQNRPLNSTQLLQKADTAADFYNWVAAAPLYATAERQAIKERHDRNILYAHVGDLRATMEARSLKNLSSYLADTVQQSYVRSDRRLLLRCLIAKGDADAEIDSAPAEADWQQVLKVAQELNDQKWQNRAIGEIGFHRYVQGDHATAKRNTAVALLAARRTGDFAAEIRFSSGIATGLALGGSPDEGLNYLTLASAQAIKHPETGYPYMTVAGRVTAYLAKQDFTAARPLIEDQIKHATADNRLVKLTQARLFLADVAVAQNDRPEAIRILQGTITIAGRNNTRMLSETYAKLSDLYREQGRLADAEHAAEVAVARSGESRSMYLAPPLLLTIARLKVAEGQNREAESYFDRATDVVEGMLAHITDTHTREALLTTMSYVYAEHFAAAAEQNDVQKAYSIIERIRGRIISELLINKSDVKDLDELDSHVEDHVVSLKLQLATEANQPKRERLLEDLFFTKQASWVSATNSQIARVSPVPVSTFRKSLLPGEVFLEYVLTDQKSYCLLIARSDIRLIPLASREGISAQVNALLAALRSQQPTEQYEESLYDLLIAPLGSLAHYDHVTIVPDGALHLLPFEMLKPVKGKYLGIANTITYAPSAASEFLLRRRKPPVATARFLGIGGVNYPNASEGKTLTAQTRSDDRNEYDLSGIYDLPYSEEEVRTAAKLVGGRRPVLEFGHDATKTALAEDDLSHYSVIHFAVHALVNSKSPDTAALVLQSNPPKADGFLEAREILRLRLNSQLVVLSACNTAVGRLQGEEGISNLTRAFLVAGSSSVVSTLWPVEDSFALFLMTKFYEHLSVGQAEADALRAAKVDVLNKFGADISPVYWAAFTLEGDGLSKLRIRRQSFGNTEVYGEGN